MKVKNFGHLCQVAAVLALVVFPTEIKWFMYALFEGIALFAYGFVWGKGRNAEIDLC